MKRVSLSLVLLSLSLAAGTVAQPTNPPQGRPAKSPPSIEPVADARAPAGWRRYRFGSPALFTALLPGPPAAVPGQPPEGDGKLWSWGFYAAGGVTTYVLTYSLYAGGAPPPKTEREKRVAYNNFAAGFADGLTRSGKFGDGVRSEVLGERRLRVADAEAFERDFSLGEQHRGRLLTVFAGEHSLSAAAVYPKDSPAAERAVFFDSLTLEMARGGSPAAAAPAGWRRYEPAGGAFSVMLPAEPSIEIKPGRPGAAGGTYYRASSDDGFYVVAHASKALPGAAGNLSAADAEFFYEQLFKAVIDELKADLKREGVTAELVAQPPRAATVGGLPGREQTLTIGGGVVEMRLQAAIAQQDVFTVLASWPLEVPLATRQNFTDSFRITPPRPAVAPRR